MVNSDRFGSRRNLVVVSAVTESRPKPCFTITAATETKNIASFSAVTKTKTEFRSVSNYKLTNPNPNPNLKFVSLASLARLGWEMYTETHRADVRIRLD